VKRSGEHVVAVVIAFFAFAACASNAHHDWRIEITTEGGISGRGLGNAVITPESVAHCDHAALDRALREAKPKSWKREYREPANPHGNADQVLTTMTLTAGGESHTTSWYTGARELVPRDAIALFDAAWALRSCGR